MPIFPFKPGRAQAESGQSQEDEILCDLDAVLSKRVTFTFEGKRHVILPITTERFFEFWKGIQAFEKSPMKDSDLSNQAFLKLIHVVCEDLTLKEAERMTVLQKALLLKHISAKITGTSLEELAQKKKMIRDQTTPLSESPPLSS